MKVQVFRTPQDTAAAAAEAFAEAARRAVAERGAFHVALSGGSTPKLMYAALRDMKVPWQRVHIYFSDERTVAPDDEQSNYHTAKVGLLDFVPVPAEQVHRLKGELDPAQAAREYAALLPAQLDVVLLGMGDDGHTASLFPGTDGLQQGGRVIANEVPQQFTWRLSFTFEEINAARERWLLVTGAAKAPVLAQVARGEGDFPVARVHDPVWYLDAAAAAELPKSGRRAQS
ncbi:6-phosphogluconolactonase [Deinococcus irradiatisoli]|uniref:6-phosphogluconolactonase n=1 Tax=Deinococcus irradiatisoli TaxID=2202254 RepID=A0A2Z3JKG1_9DEIO|nr:6-phosphogluconolactonase [Deinococcus irradiatisoli]AWN22408.1 6-phosphogluconolactonase [Deinococcus irradiatisoli]